MSQNGIIETHRRDVAESRPRRGHREDSIYYDRANRHWVAAVSLGYKGGKRVRRKVTGRTKTEVRTKLRDLRCDLDHGVRSSATYTVSDALDDWLGGRSDRARELYRDTVKPLHERLGEVKLRELMAGTCTRPSRRWPGGCRLAACSSLEDGVERGGEVRSAVADQELDALELLVEAEGEVAGLLHGPLARRARGDPAEMDPAGAMFDEHQDIQSLQQHGVHVQEVDREDPGCLGVQELPPCRGRAAWGGIDACGVQDLPDGGRRGSRAGFRQFAVDPAVSPRRPRDRLGGSPTGCRTAPIRTRCGPS